MGCRCHLEECKEGRRTRMEFERPDNMKGRNGPILNEEVNKLLAMARRLQTETLQSSACLRDPVLARGVSNQYEALVAMVVFKFQRDR